jgi:hypothetical protein
MAIFLPGAEKFFHVAVVFAMFSETQSAVPVGGSNPLSEFILYVNVSGMCWSASAIL